jgi:hypothetical protein
MAEAALPEKRREIQIKKQKQHMSKRMYFIGNWGRKELLKMHISCWRNNIKNFIIIVYSSG